MSVDLRRLILPIVPYLQHPILGWPFKLYYRLATAAAVRSARRFPGVTAVYLSGSLARGEPVWGLSDIDLKIIVDGDEDQPLARRIRGRLQRLALVFPILGSYHEKGVFFSESLTNRIDRYPLLRHLFDPDFYPDRLLWGDDVLPELTGGPADDLDRLLSYLWKAKFWLEKVFVYAEEPRLTRLQRLYLMTKAIANCGEMLALVEPGGTDPPSSDGLETMAGALPHHEGLIRRLRIDRRTLFRQSELEPSEVFDVVMAAIRALTRSINGAVSDAAGSSPTPELRISGREWEPPPEEADAWRKALAASAPDGCTIRLFPPLLIGVSVLDLDHAHLPVLLLDAPQPLAYPTILELRRIWREQVRGRALVLIRDNPDLIYPLHTDLLGHWLMTDVEDGQIRLATGAADNLEPTFISLAAHRLQHQLPEIRRLADDRRTRHMSDTALADLVRACLRNLALLSSIEAGAFELATDLPGAVRRLASDGRIMDADAGRIEAGGADPASLLRFAGRLAAVFEGDSDRPEKRPSLDECIPTRESVSVVIITRNRAEQLRRCLASLAGQTRAPDEILVVDNASSDHTRDVVMAASCDPAPRYLLETTVGYGRARNAGVETATGDIIAFIDDDAVASPGWLEAIVQPFRRDPAVGIVGGSIRTLEEDRHDPVYRYHTASEGGRSC